MATFPRLFRRVFPVWRITAFGALLFGLALPSGMAGFGSFGNGPNMFGGYRGGGFAAYRPAASYHPTRNNVPRSPTPQRPVQSRTAQPKTAHQNYVPPKHVPQPRVTQKAESRQHPAIQPSISAPKTHVSPGQFHANTSKPSPSARRGNSLTEQYRRSTSTDQPRRERSFKQSRSIASHQEHAHNEHLHSDHLYGEYRHHLDPYHHHHWHHRWWYDDDYYYDGDYYGDYYYDGYGYAASPYFYYDDTRRQMAIDYVGQQIAAAEEVLDSAVSRQEVLEQQREAAQQRINKASTAIKSAVEQQLDSNKSMREIEARLTAQQGPDSELAQARAKVDAARAAIDTEVHRVLGLPPHAGTPTAADYAHEVAMLAPAQKDQLNKDSQFREATGKLRAAAKDVAKVQQALFEKDSDWVAARDEALNAKRTQTEADRELSKDTGVGQLGKKVELQSVQTLVEQARAVIAMGRAALRSLGARLPSIMADERPNWSSGT